MEPEVGCRTGGSRSDANGIGNVQVADWGGWEYICLNYA